MASSSSSSSSASASADARRALKADEILATVETATHEPMTTDDVRRARTAESGLLPLGLNGETEANPTKRHFPQTQVEDKERLEEREPLSRLSKREEKEWNHMAEGMEYYHTHFRMEFDQIYELADGKFNKRGMSLPAFLRTARGLYQHLDMHHKIEETHIFPILAKKMPQFGRGHHLKSHKAIHKGMDEYLALLEKYSQDPSSYDPQELRRCMDSWKEVLFTHLDEEVRDLGHESMRRAGWTLEEVRRMPM